MKYIKIPLACFFVIVSACKPAVENNAGPWPEQTSTNRPWTRWWWMGNGVNRTDLGHLLEKYHEAGFGGVEITPIFGAIGFEDQYIDFLSPEWMDVLNYTTEKAETYNMQVDMNLGTGWPFGGPQITARNAASKLIIQTYKCHGGSFSRKITINDSAPQDTVAKLLALTAYDRTGRRLSLLDKLDSTGRLSWTADKGEWIIFAAFGGKTGQQVKRAAPGGEGYTMDHLSIDALNQYLGRFDDAFGKQSPQVRGYFNDSYEVYDADFSDCLFDEFQQRRGYDARLYIRELVSAGNSDSVRRIQADYRRTMSEMLLNNFTLPWSAWIHGKHGLSRNQAHGSPGNLLDLYASVDIPECETYGYTRFPIPGLHEYTFDTLNVQPDPLMMKFATSAANVMGKKLASSETFTWLGEHFKVPLQECKAQAEVAFLAGVNHIFYHGTTYSPESVAWPGWLFYASVNFAPSNSFWPHLSGLNDYITRCQSVLQSGHTGNDILLYWPVEDAWHTNGKLDMQLSVHNIGEWLQPTAFYKLARSLTEKGFAFDFVSDRMISMAGVVNHAIRITGDGTAYKVIVVPETNYMPLATLNHLLLLAEKGAVIIFERLPFDVPGFSELKSRKDSLHSLLAGLSMNDSGLTPEIHNYGEGMIILSHTLPGALHIVGVKEEELVNSGLKYIKKVDGGDTWYYLVNHTSDTISEYVALNATGRSVIILNPLDGRFGKATYSNKLGMTRVRLNMKPGEALFIRISARDHIHSVKWDYLFPEDRVIEINGPWKLSFTEGGPLIPDNRETDSLISWTESSDSALVWFSGTARYHTTFVLDSLNSDEYILDLGDVRESARVWVNDKDAGIVWSVPAQARIGSFLHEGENSLEIEVANLMANRIIYMDTHGLTWRNFHEINFVDLTYRPFDASTWPWMPSGLLGPVKIIPLCVDQ